MARVLVTGVSARHVGGTGRVDYANAAPAMVLALRAGGVQVDQREIEFGEDLSCYDRILVGWNQPNSIAVNPKRLIKLSWITAHFLDKFVLFYDDWSAMKCNSGGPKTIVRTWDKRKKWYEERIGREMTDDEADYLLRMMKLFADDYPFEFSLIPSFAWSDDNWSLVRAFDKVKKAITWDPTPFTDILEEVDEDKTSKERRWIHATLQDHDEWLGKRALKWPVEKFGRPKERGFAGKQTGASTGQELLPEVEIRRIYHRSWGVLGPKYPAAGWWRARFYHAAEAGSILLCDESDQLLMGAPHQIRGWQVEGMSDDRLAELAEKQKVWIEERVATREQTIAKVTSVLMKEGVTA